MRSSVVSSDVPGHEASSGHDPHHVNCLLPPSDWHVESTSQNLSSCTSPPPVVQSSRVAAATQVLPPVRQQKTGLGTGSRLPPHLFRMTFDLRVSAAASFCCTVASAKQSTRVAPVSQHEPRALARNTRYLSPALPMPFWQLVSFPLVPRFRWSGSGVVQPTGWHTGDVASRLPSHASTACEA